MEWAGKDCRGGWAWWCLLVLLIQMCIAADLFAVCDARRTTAARIVPREASPKKQQMLKAVMHLDDPSASYASTSDPYYTYVGSPFAFPPFDDIMGPASSPEGQPTYCVYPPPTGQIQPQPPSTSNPPTPIPDNNPQSPPPSTSNPPTPIPDNNPQSPPPSTSNPPTPIPDNNPQSPPPPSFTPTTSSPPPPSTLLPPSPTTPTPSSPPFIINPTPPSPDFNIPLIPTPPSPDFNIPLIPSPPNPPISQQPPTFQPSPPSFQQPPTPPAYIPFPPIMVFPTPPQPGQQNPPSFNPGGRSPPTVFLPPIVFPPPSAPLTPPSGPNYSQYWCVAKPSVPDPIILEAMNYACASGADCDSIQPQGLCYEPDTLIAHASYAFNSYWQRTRSVGGTCDFGGTATLVTRDPSFDGCHYLRT